METSSSVGRLTRILETGEVLDPNDPRSFITFDEAIGVLSWEGIVEENKKYLFDGEKLILQEERQKEENPKKRIPITDDGMAYIKKIRSLYASRYGKRPNIDDVVTGLLKLCESIENDEVLKSLDVNIRKIYKATEEQGR